MEKRVNLDEQDPTVLDLLAQVAPGDEVVLEWDGKIVGRLQCDRPVGHKKKLIVLGGWQGLVHVRDDFFDPMTEEELADWYEGDLDSFAPAARH